MNTHPNKSRAPLSGQCLFQSDDLDMARAFVAQKFCDHRLDRASVLDHFDACHNRAEGEATSLNFIRYGADVMIDPGALGSFYLIQIPLTGHADIDNEAGMVRTGMGKGSVLNPHRQTRMRWHEGCSQLLLQIDADHLRQVAERMAGRSLNELVTFNTAVDERSQSVANWVRRLKTCFALADQGAIYATDNLHTQLLVEEQLIMDFLLCQPSDIRDAILRARSLPDNVHIRKAVSYIRAHLSQAITMADVAKEVGVTPRSLQLGFKAEFAQTPMEFLREERLQEARRLLMVSDEQDRIGDICERVGFNHFGRFSVQYRQRFGESPTETRGADKQSPARS